MEQKLKISCLHPAFLIATWFGIGKMPFAPGTMGSIGAFPLFLLSHYLLCLGWSETSFNYIYIACIAVLFLLGVWASKVYMEKTGEHDPGTIVIDEVVGQIIVFFAAFSAFAPFIGVYDVMYGSVTESSQEANIEALHEFFRTSTFLIGYATIGLPAYILSFLLFRLFDIWKPWPIRWCDKNIKGGFGVMFDDIFAAAYAIVTLYAIVLVIPLVFPPPPAPVIPPTEIIQ